MSMVQGIVSRKSSNEYGHGVLVDGKWYNSKYPIKCEEGDSVEFDDGGRNYCRKLRVTGTSGATGNGKSEPTGAVAIVAEGTSVALPRDRAIIRQNALTNAVNLVSNYVLDDSFMGDAGKTHDSDEVVSKVLSIARQFEAYSSGDVDVETVDGALHDEDS